MAGNPFDMFDTTPSGPVYGAPPKVGRYEDEDQQIQRAAAARDAAAASRSAEDAERKDREWAATHNPDGSPKKPPRNFSDGKAAEIEKEVGQFAGLERSRNAFTDDFGDNWFGRVENQAQALVGDDLVGTKGQRDWWASFDRIDTKIRNELFGATLTPSEQASYEATTIYPSMDSGQIRDNLKTRTGILREALERKRKYALAAGYEPDQVDALFEPLSQNRLLEDTVPSADGEQRDDSPYAVKPIRNQSGGLESPFGPADPYGNLTDGDRSSPLPDDLISDGKRIMAGDPMPGSQPARGTSKREFDPQLSARVDAMVKQGVSLDDINEFVTGIGGQPIDSREYAAVRNFLAKNPNYEGSLVNAYRTEPLSQYQQNVAKLGGHEIAAGYGDIVEGAGDIAGIVGNPLNATINAMTGSDLTTDYGGSARETLGLPQGDALISAVNQGGVAALTGSLAARGAAALARPGLVQDAARIVGSAPATDTVAGAAAGGGAEFAREAGAGPVGQIAAGVLAGAPVVAARGLASRPARVPTPLAQAAERQNVDLMPADTGSPMVGRVTGGLQQSPVSAGPITTAAQASQRQTGEAATRAARSQAPGATTDIAGENVRGAAERYSAQTSSRGDRLYTRAERLAQGAQIPPTRALQSIDGYIARLSELGGTNGPLINDLRTLRDDIGQGASVAALRDLRTNLRGNASPGGQLRSDQQQHMYREIINDLSQDIEVGLRRAGRGSAANAFRRADTYWRERVEQIDQVLQPIIGRDGTKGGEQIIQTLESMTQGRFGGNRRLSRLVANMEPDEAANVRAVVIDRLGRATPGQQGAEGDAFSAATFLTNWNKMTPQAKATLFGSGDLRQNLDDIATVAEGTRNAGRYANHSNTGGANVTTLGFYGLAGAADLKTAAIMAAMQYGTAQLMASPGFARWLARAPATNAPGVVRMQINRLGTLAGREAAISTDARALQQQLQNAFGQSPSGKLAAEEEDKDVRREPIGR